MKKKIFVIVQCVLLIMIIMSTTIIEATGFLTTYDEENVFKLLLGQSDTDARFNLKDIIPENINVRNQGRANNCWDFAAIGALETTLALKRKKQSAGLKVFDFSEAHVKYGSRYSMFLNGEKNAKGFNAVRSDGGNFMDAINYMTNGFGPVDEKWLKYNPNEPDIDLNSIESITQASTVMDTVNLSVEDTSDENAINDAISKIKTHIKNYGGVYFALNYRVGDQYTNKVNMARYCDVPLQNNESASHVVVLIGWDDNYSASNFKKNPGKNGAWIFKNSYGDYSTVEYLSYYDKTSYTETYGFQDVEEGKNYDKQYQHQVLPPIVDFHVKKGSVISQLTVAEVYSRDPSKANEKITRLSIEAAKSGIYEFFVNPDNDDLTNLTKVSVNKIYLRKGFHTLKLNNPVKLTGSKFVVAAKMPNVDNQFNMMYEARNTVEGYTASVSEPGETYVNYVDNRNAAYWKDFVVAGKGNSSLKAYVNFDSTQLKATKIKILSEPNKLEYIKDTEKLDVTGGKILVSMSNGETIEKSLEDSKIKLTGFDNSSVGPKTITVDYMDNRATFVVNVIDSPNQLISLTLKKAPTKVEYMVNDTLVRDGGILQATYSNGKTAEISTNSTSVKFSSPNMTVPGTKNVTITYGGKSVNYSILVKEKPITLNKIEVLNLPIKTDYIQNTENLDLTAGKIRAIFSNGNVLDIQMDSSDVNVIGFNNANIGRNRLTVSYKGKSTFFDINIVEKPKATINDAWILRKPDKLKYKKGEELNLSGGKITVNYSDGTNKIVTMDNSELVQYSNFNSNSLGVQNVALKLKDFNKLLNFEVEVIKDDPVIDQNKVLENKILENQIINNQIVQNKVIENRVIANKIENNRIIENQIISNNIISNKIENNKIVENQIVHNKILENQIVHNKILENKIAENKVNENKVVENNVNNSNVVHENKVQNNISENIVNSNQVNENKTNNDNIDNNKENFDVFANSKAEIIDVNNFVYTDSNKNYIEIEINVSNIKILDSKDYYIKYYLAGNAGEKITDDQYVLINNLNKQSDGSYSAKFKINSKELNNITDIINSDVLYLYLKAKNGSNVSKKILTLNNMSKVKNYINNKKVDKIDKENLNKNKDDTVYNRILPQTGALPGLLVAFVLISIIGSLSYFKFKNINK
jgi:transcription factor with AP2 domain(S), putative